MALRQAIIAAALALAACQGGDDGGGLEAGSQPNILVIMADDLGYLDLGVFGSEISTPNIDALAANGMIMTNFYSSPVCATTRAMLMTGIDHHQVGMGAQAPASFYPGNSPNYQGYLTDRSTSVATRLSELGYATYMVGKWHLGEEEDQSPSDRGFDRSFALLPGGASHWGDMQSLFAPAAKAPYREDGVLLESLPEEFDYSTDFYTGKMISYIDEGLEGDQPFFGYLAYTAPHWPVQAPDEDIARQKGRYDEGYDVIRERRFERWKQLGYGPADMQLPPDPPDYVAWDTLNEEEKARSARSMEVYAAMVERLDAQIGRLLDHLEDKGVLDNTLIAFMADNGAEGGAYAPAGYDYSYENMGRPGSYTTIGPGWAEAGSAPFYLRKVYVAEGGIHVPAIVSAPGLGLGAGRSEALAGVFDLAPTFVELAGGENTPGGTANLVMTGTSFAPVLRGETDTARPHDGTVAWELHGARAIRQWPWKAEWMFPPHGTGEWRLYNLAEDPTQRSDVAADNPEILAAMVADWDAYAEENGVIVLEQRMGAGPPPDEED